MIYEYEMKTALSDIDKNGFVTNRAILRYFENMATYHANSLGCGIDDTYTKGVTWIVLDWSMKILNRPQYRDKLIAKTWSRGTEKFFAYRDFELVNSLGETCVIGTSRYIIRNIEDKKMMIFTRGLSEKYQSENKAILPNENFSKLRIPSEFSNELEYTVMRKDIDFNKHMHNLCHFDLAYEVLPEEVYENCNFNNFRISYKKEIKLGETVKCQYSKIDDKNIVYISNAEGNMNSVIYLW